METNCHDTICSVECFFYTIAVVDIDVNVEHTRMIPDTLWSGLVKFSSERLTRLTEAVPGYRAQCLWD